MIDLYASQPHYYDHLQPIFEALPGGCQGDIIVHPSVNRPAARVAQNLTGTNPIMVAGFTDLKRAGTRRPIIFVEHGAGQRYDLQNGAYSGGPGRGRVSLFLCPNESVREANAARYPQIPAVVVGSARVEWLAKRRHAARAAVPAGRARVVAFSWHFDGTVWPHANSALPHYERDLGAIVGRLQRKGWTVLGHGHPKAWPDLSRLWHRLGVEPVREFEQVVERADVYVCDNSSTIFEAAAIGVPVVLLDAPWYDRQADLGLRFWTWADIGPRISDPSDIVAGVLNAESDEWVTMREMMRETVYPVIDGAAHRAAEAIIDVIGTEGCRPDLEQQ